MTRPPAPILLLLSLLAITAFAQAEPPLPGMTIRAPLMAKTPDIDGAIHEAEWDDAFRGVGMIAYQKNLYVPRQTAWWIGTDGKMIYAAMRSELPTKGELLARVKPKKRDPFGLGMDDGVELWLAPNYAPGGKTRYCQFAGNPLGAISDTMFDPTKSVDAQKWDGRWQFANQYRNGWWESEIAIAVGELGVTAPLRSFGFRITRNWKQPWVYSSTESAPGGFKDVRSMSQFHVDPEAPRIEVLGFDKWMDGQSDLKLAITNAGVTPLEARARIDAEAPVTGMAAQVGQQVVSLEPGEREEVCFRANLSTRAIWTTKLVVSSRDAQKVWLSRRWRCRTERPEEIWTTVKREKKAVTLYFGYSPYASKMRAKVDFSGIREPDTVRRVLLSVWRKGGSEALKEVTVASVTDHSAETMFDVPELPDGEYEIRCTLDGDEVLKDAVVGAFERKRHEWEHNTLGISDEVIEPFKPLQVEGTTVKAILREHKLNELGLWEQVFSEGKPLLSGPMTLRASVSGQEVAWEAEPLRFPEAKPSSVTAEAVWRGNGISGRTVSRFDYDGLMTLELKLGANKEATIDRLDLVVPVRSKEAWLMHATGAGFSKNYGGKIPEAEGEVWDNTKAETYGLPNQFLPYVWIGGTRRGVCWYADSDKDWVVGEDEREVSLVRDGDTVSMVLHLVGKPAKLDRERSIKFGFQATPVKLRPENWRNWNFYWGAVRPHTRYVQILGCCPYWGAVTTSGDVYPRNRDFSFIERLAAINKRKKITADDRRFLAEWDSGYRQKKHLEFYKRCTAYGFRCAETADLMVPYTNIRGVRETLPEFLLFQDEWLTMSYSSRKWRDEDKSEVKIEPVRSHQDYALWYYKKMMDLGFAAGIYWDLSFAVANYNLLSSSAAYRADDGTIHPGVGITSVRELIKRTAVMYRQAGRFPYHVDHMSNNAIIPKQAFTTIQLDWELKYGTDDFQDKFSEDYIFATTTGEQAGTVPLVLTGIRGVESKEQSTWLTRTLLGTILVYDLRGWFAFPMDRALNQKILGFVYDFGYGQPDCKVYRYWDDPPFKTNRKDLRCILFERGGRLMLVGTDFGDGGPCRVTIDMPRLGIGASGLAAVNQETGEEMALDSNSVAFDLRKHDFCVLLIESRREGME